MCARIYTCVHMCICVHSLQGMGVRSTAWHMMSIYSTTCHILVLQRISEENLCRLLSSVALLGHVSTVFCVILICSDSANLNKAEDKYSVLSFGEEDRHVPYLIGFTRRSQTVNSKRTKARSVLRPVSPPLHMPCLLIHLQLKFYSSASCVWWA